MNGLSGLAPRLRASIATLTLAVGLLAMSAGCASIDPSRLTPGTSGKALVEERALGVRRSYRLHLPAGVDPTAATPLPLVVVLHGGFGSGRIVERQSSFSALADREGFLVAYPNGIGVLGMLRHWNGGWCCGKALADDLDDVGFVARVIDDVARHHPVDRGRVFLVGYSNGGMLAYRFASQRPQGIAALGIFASTVGLVEPDGEPRWLPEPPATPVPAVLVHGRDDDRLDYDGQEERKAGARTLGAEESAAWWARANGCSEPPRRDTVLAGALERLRWCADESTAVTLYAVEGWGHDWPGPRFTQRLDADDPRHALDSAERMWRFFEAHASR